MGTLQSELAKVQTLDNMSFDDDADKKNEIIEVLDAAQSTRQIVWQYLLEHPMSSGRNVSDALSISNGVVHRALNGMYRNSILSRREVNGVFHYTPTSTTYPIRGKNEGLIKAWAKRTELSKAGLLAKRYAEKRKQRTAPVAKPAKPKAAKSFKTIGKAPPPPVPQAPVEETIQMVPTYDPNVVATWPVSMARAFYIELKKYFGDV